MFVSVIYKESEGGDGDVDRLRKALEAAGHRVLAVEPAEDGGRPLHEHTEVAIAFGGDGTVGSTIARIHGTPIRLGIVPYGTANNIARTLHVVGGIDGLAGGLAGAREVPFDIGLVRGAFGTRTFVESVGAGLIHDGIAAMDAAQPHAERKDAAAMLDKARRCFLRHLQGATARRCRVLGDDRHVEDDLLLVEVMNIRTIGPGLRLCPAVDSGDGWFDVVAVREADRAALAELLEHDVCDMRWPTWQARRVWLHGCTEIHVDDDTGIDAGGGEVSLEVLPGAVRVLVPKVLVPG